MRRRIAAVLFALAAVVVSTAQHPEPPANADMQRLFLPIVARNALADRGPMTRWTAYARTRFNDLVVDANGIVFASTDDGVLRWDSASATGEHRWLTEADGVPAGTIGALALDAAGNLWLAAKPTETIADADATTGVRRVAPDGTWQAFTTADGLAGNAVYAIEVDPEGRVWVAAWHGVSRQEADGTWTTVRNPNENLRCDGLDCRHTKLAIAFGGGMAWFGNAGGVSRLNSSGRWYEWAANPVHRIAADRLGGCWTADAQGAYVTRYGADNVTHGVAARQRYSFAPADLVFDTADRLWVGGANNVESIGADGRWRVEGGPAGLPTDGLTRLAVDPGGRVWAALGGTIVRVDADGRGPVLRVGLPLAGGRVNSIAPDLDGSVWLGIADNASPLGGLVHIDRDGHWTSRGLQAGQPDPAGVGRVLVGADGTLWASDGQRLVRLGPDGTETLFESRALDARAYFGDLVLDGDGTLWTDIRGNDESTPADGILAIFADGRTQHLTHLPMSPDGPTYVQHPMAYDAGRRELWFGGFGLTVRGAGGDWRVVDAPDGLADAYVQRMLVDRAGGRWFASGDDLWSLSADGRWSDRRAELRSAFAGKAYGGIQAFAADMEGGIWLGTKGGLVRLDADGRWQRIAVSAARPDEVRDWQRVFALAFDGAGRLWVGTDAGVARLE